MSTDAPFTPPRKKPSVFWWIGGRAGVSRAHGFDGSLLLAPGAFGNILVTVVMVLIAIVLGTVIAGTVRPDAGLFAAAAGLVALSVAGLSYLAERGVTESMLYVDESNAAAVRLYRKLGFEVFAADVMYAQ